MYVGYFLEYSWARILCGRNLPSCLWSLQVLTNSITKLRLRTLLPYYLTLFVLTSGLGNVMALIAEFQNQLGFTSMEIGFIIALGFFGSGFASIILGPYADRGKSPLLLRAGLVMGVISLLILAVGTELWQFMVARTIYGLALGTAAPAVKRSIILMDPDNFGRNLGRLGAVDVAGFAVGPLVAAICTALGDFQTAFWVTAIMLLLVIPTVWRAKPDPGRQDTAGRLSFSLLRSKQLIGAFFFVAGYWIWIAAFEPVWVMEMNVRGASQWQIGLALSVVVIPIAVLAPFGGSLAQKYGPRLWSCLCLLSCAAFCILFGVVEGLMALIVVTLISSCFEGLGFASTTIFVSESTPEDRQAAAQGLSTAIQVVAAGLATLGATAIYQITNDTVTWFVVSGTILVCLATGWLLTRGNLSRRSLQD